jgi:hypothetical protein
VIVVSPPPPPSEEDPDDPDESTGTASNRWQWLLIFVVGLFIGLVVRRRN